jgi:integrase
VVDKHTATAAARSPGSAASVKVIQVRLGHASAKTTLEVYGHTFADEEDHRRAAIDAELSSRCAPDVHPRGARTT